MPVVGFYRTPPEALNWSVIHADTRRRDRAAGLAKLLFRGELWEQLRALPGCARHQFPHVPIEALTARLEQFERQPWTKETVRAARRDPVLHTWEIAGLQSGKQIAGDATGAAADAISARSTTARAPLARRPGQQAMRH
jgi:hypothetical protein